MRSQQECKKQKQRKRLTRKNKKIEPPFKRDKSKMNLWLKRNVENFITFRLNLNQSRLQGNQRLKLRLLPFNLILKVRLKSRSLSSKLKLVRFLNNLSFNSKKKRSN